MEWEEPLNREEPFNRVTLLPKRARVPLDVAHDLCSSVKDSFPLSGAEDTNTLRGTGRWSIIHVPNPTKSYQQLTDWAE